MQSTPAPVPLPLDNVAELRALYRAAEARAARLRLLTEAGRELAGVTSDTAKPVLERCAQRLALFVGVSKARLHLDPSASGLAVAAPGRSDAVLARLELRGVGRLADIADAEDRAAAALLLELMGTTLDRIRRDDERSALLDALREREGRLESLVGQVLAAQEEERRRVARDLHDGVAQTATALFRMLDAADQRVGGGKDKASPAQIARSLVRELRRVIAGLRPTLLDDLGLEAAVQALAEQLQEDGYTVAMTVEPLRCALTGAAETALFRVAQEAITNIRKHAGRAAVAVVLRRDDTGVVLRVTDDGAGAGDEPMPDPARGHAGGARLGIDGMKERMAMIGGSLDWCGPPGKGVSVTARLPVS
ncbi:sensor histidine kinase [Erythrobacteraceae bacterium CFH 75059]|uniref:sensor histidine kinase n=1 Tax=Qipengyuania thermophila TaxID=2509361 RepID=UPI00101EAB1F|nr:sensor histidine kinase [Qipengyuania thermophila]TCD06673.1 sensor histidine kinase [Erythrobacteraceae bacterium CFH 75059]